MKWKLCHVLYRCIISVNGTREGCIPRRNANGGTVLDKRVRYVEKDGGTVGTQYPYKIMAVHEGEGTLTPDIGVDQCRKQILILACHICKRGDRDGFSTVFHAE